MDNGTAIREGIRLYHQLDDIDKAEIRGEMHYLLRQCKYQNQGKNNIITFPKERRF